jgi:L-2,4-diaminobutyrate decarboxylase
MMKLAGYGENGGGILTSGGSLATLTALLAMRQSKAGFDAWGDGLAAHQPLAVFVSNQVHYCNTRACAILGIGEAGIFEVKTDANYRMELTSLSNAFNAALERGCRPVAVVATTGTTATGSHDDLNAIADFCRDHDLWLHVDATHGGSALLSSRYSGQLKGIERADSLVWDAHKMMLMPSPCTVVLFRNHSHLDETFRQQAAYLMGSNDDMQWYKPALRNFECTKSTMVLGFYAALRVFGTDYFRDYIDYTYDLARSFAQELNEDSRFELVTEPESNIVCFRWSGGGHGEALQFKLRDLINQQGNFFITRTTLRGEGCLRVLIMNPQTRLTHLRQLREDLAKLGQDLTQVQK